MVASVSFIGCVGGSRIELLSLDDGRDDVAK